jgi:hypothetical protein
VPGRERLGAGRLLRLVQAERASAHGGLLRVVGRHRLRSIDKVNTGGAPLGRRARRTARHGAGHETMALGALPDVALRPRHRVGARGHGHLCFTRAGQCLWFACPGHHVEHVGHLGRGAHGIGKSVHGLHELRPVTRRLPR